MFQETFAINEIEICLFHTEELVILYKKSKGVSGSTRPTKVNLSGVKFHRSILHFYSKNMEIEGSRKVEQRKVSKASKAKLKLTLS